MPVRKWKNLQELFRRVASNICIGNSDDHFRNHSFLLTPKGCCLFAQPKYKSFFHRKILQCKLVFELVRKEIIYVKKKIFRCQECGYETEIYEGRGFMGQHIEAMSCPDCRNIVPLVVGGVIGDAAPSFNSLVGRLCLRCGSDRIHRWDMHTCPKCGGKMQPTGEEEFWT